MLGQKVIDQRRLAIVGFTHNEQIRHAMCRRQLQKAVESGRDLLGPGIADPAAATNLGDPLFARHLSSSIAKGTISAKLDNAGASTSATGSSAGRALTGRRTRTRRARLVSVTARASCSRNRAYAAKIAASSIGAAPLAESVRRSSRNSHTLSGG